MRTWLIVSDTHGRLANLRAAVARERPFGLIHLGDVLDDASALAGLVPGPVELVAGNGDHDPRLDRERIVRIGAHTLLLVHGHRHDVHAGPGAARRAATAAGADIVCYGHTHVPLLMTDDTPWVVNPGSLTAPRQAGGRPTYVRMVLDGDGRARFTLKRV